MSFSELLRLDLNDRAYFMGAVLCSSSGTTEVSDRTFSERRNAGAVNSEDRLTRWFTAIG